MGNVNLPASFQLTGWFQFDPIHQILPEPAAGAAGASSMRLLELLKEETSQILGCFKPN